MEHATYFSNYLRGQGCLGFTGTRLWAAPEYEDRFYDQKDLQLLQFNPTSYRLGDYFSLGAILYELMTGVQPIGDSVGIFQDKIFEDGKQSKCFMSLKSYRELST